MKPAWRGPIFLAAGSALLVAAIQYCVFGSSHPKFISDLWWIGVVGGQMAALSLWASWSPEAAWKRVVAVVAYGWIPSCLMSWRGWLRTGSFLDGADAYLPQALVLMIFMAILIPLGCIFGYRLSNSPREGAALNTGSFRLAEMFALTFVVAVVLGILVPIGQQQSMETKEIYFLLAQLAVVLGYVLAVLFPCVRVAFSIRFAFVWLVVFLIYLIVAVIAAAECICGLVSLRYGTLPSGEAWEVRGSIIFAAAGFWMSLLPTLFLLRLVGFRVMIGRPAADKMTACETA